jgi:hypothetical protein
LTVFQGLRVSHTHNDCIDRRQRQTLLFTLTQNYGM